MAETNALLAQLDELEHYHTEIADALEAGANVLELEVNEDTADLRNAWGALRSNLARAQAATADLRTQRQGVAQAAAAPATRNPIDDEA